MLPLCNIYVVETLSSDVVAMEKCRLSGLLLQPKWTMLPNEVVTMLLQHYLAMLPDDVVIILPSDVVARFVTTCQEMLR